MQTLLLFTQRRPPRLESGTQQTLTPGFTMGVSTDDTGKGKPLQRTSRYIPVIQIV